MKTNTYHVSHAKKDSLKSTLGTYFGAHGCFCASHPWEVIVTTMTIMVCVLSAGVLVDKDDDLLGTPFPYLKKPNTEEV